MDALTPPGPACPGPLRRREFLRLGLAGLGSLTWPELLRDRAEAGTGRPRQDTALLVVWLHGGASHLETYDPKPLAPAEYRGPYRPIPTRVPGLQLSELLPRHAQIAHRFTLLRSLAHTGPCHDSGPQQLFTGFPITVNRLKPDHPDLRRLTVIGKPVKSCRSEEHTSELQSTVHLVCRPLLEQKNVTDLH